MVLTQKNSRAKPGRFANRLVALMSAKAISAQALKDLAEVSYEHIRKLVTGVALPSKGLVKEIAGVLKVPAGELQDLADFDRIHRKYGEAPAKLAGRNPEIEPLNLLWSGLTQMQKEELLVLARFFVDRNQAPRTKQNI